MGNIYLSNKPDMVVSSPPERGRDGVPDPFVYEGFEYETAVDAQNAMANMLLLVNQAGMPDTDAISLRDKNGQLVGMTVAQFKSFAVAYGVYCYQAFVNG